VFWDGVDVTTLFTTSALATDREDFSIGRITGAPLPSADFFYGSIDEVRVSTVVRSPDWIRAQYLSMIDAFIDWGSD
jgi:hypothetical protein